MTVPKTKTYSAALMYLDAQISILPVKSDGSKAPALPVWKPLQSQPFTTAQAGEYFANGNGIGVIGGAVSGGFNPLDFDEPGLCDLFEAACADHGLGGLVFSLPRIETPSGGSHLYLRCEAGARPNEVLARSADSKKRIETRGEGGYVVAPPSAGYKVLRGRPHEIPTLSGEERGALWAVASLFNDYIEEQAIAPEPAQAGGEGTRPGDDYNQRGDVETLLQKHGWKLLTRSGGRGLWRRPGKDKGISATSNYADRGLFYPFSTSAAPFEAKKGYKGFSVYAMLEHNGDFAAAARELGRQGYGQPPRPPKPKTAKKEAEPEADAGELPEKDASPLKSDMDLALAWAAEVENSLLYVEGDQWYAYAGNVWKYSSTEFARAQCHHFIKRMAGIGRVDKAHSYSLENNILGLAKSELGPVPSDSFNSHHGWIPLANGVYDTATSQLIPHDPLHKITYQLPFEYDEGATCPLWLNFLNECLIYEDGRTCLEWIGMLQEWFGYCLIPDATAQTAMFWIGEGGNGKGSATRILTALIGAKYCTAIPVEMLHDPYHRAEIQGKLVGLVEEIDARAMAKNANHFKAIVGGDPISARRPTEKVFTFLPTCRIVISCNRLPSTKDVSRGYFRRVRLIEWRYNVPSDKKDLLLDEKLKMELPGIFNWALEGLRRVKERSMRMTESQESQKLLDAYKEAEDPIGRFFDEELTFDKEGVTPSKELYSLYRGWCEENGLRPETNQMFGRRLAKQKAQPSRPWVDGIQVRGWRGVRLKKETDAPETENANFTA